MWLQYCTYSLTGLGIKNLQLKDNLIFAFSYADKLISWTYKHVHAFSFSNLYTPIILLDKEKVHL